MRQLFAAFPLALLLVTLPSRAVEPSDAPADEARAVIEDLVACGTRHSLSSWTDEKRGIGCGRNAVVRRFRALETASGGQLRVVVDRFEASSARTGGVKVPLENVLAVLDGTDPSRKTTAFVISGHLDSMPSDITDPQTDAPGADDDASGVAVSLLAARVLSAAPHRATIVLAAVSGEEQGLLGGTRLLAWLAEQGYRIGGMATNDIVGASNGSPDRRPRVFSEGGPDGVDSPGRELARRIDELVGKARVRLVFRSDRFGRGGDHIPFVEAGHPAVRFTEPLEDYRHEHQTPRTENGVAYGDVMANLDFPLVAETAAVNTRWLAELADAPAPPLAVRLAGAVTPNARITIDAAEDAARSGFEILHRETTEARWSVLKTVDGAGEAVLPGTSTDNEYFAARAVGRNGAKSLAIPAVAVSRPAPVLVSPTPGVRVPPTPAR